MKKTLGIIGCGAMGRLIGLHVQDRLAHLYDLAGVSSRTEAHAETLGRELSVPACLWIRSFPAATFWWNPQAPRPCPPSSAPALRRRRK